MILNRISSSHHSFNVASKSFTPSNNFIVWPPKIFETNYESEYVTLYNISHECTFLIIKAHSN